MRSWVCRVLVAAVMALPLVGAGNAASAAPLDLVCPFTANVQFAPGLSLASEPQQLSGFAAAGTAVSSLTPCSSALTGLPYTGLSGPFYGTGNLGCVAVGAGGLAGSANGTIPITWNNGDTSTITWSASLGGIVPTIVARVTEGALLGSNVALVPAPTALVWQLPAGAGQKFQRHRACDLRPQTHVVAVAAPAGLRTDEPGHRQEQDHRRDQGPPASGQRHDHAYRTRPGQLALQAPGPHGRARLAHRDDPQHPQAERHVRAQQARALPRRRVSRSARDDASSPTPELAARRSRRPTTQRREAALLLPSPRHGTRTRAATRGRAAPTRTFRAGAKDHVRRGRTASSRARRGRLRCKTLGRPR